MPEQRPQLGQPRHRGIRVHFNDYVASPAGCGEFYEMEVVYRAGNGTVENWYLVFPRARGTVQGPETISFSTHRTDPGTYGAFTRSKAFNDINDIGGLTQYRLRTTNYAGLSSVWGPLVCFDCPR